MLAQPAEIPSLRRHDPDQVQGFGSRHLSPLQDTPRNIFRMEYKHHAVNFTEIDFTEIDTSPK